jgi:hypothetical protein
MPTGQKHLIKCRCVLPQFKQSSSPPNHQFVVFSVINDDGTVKVKHVQCNNCGIVHKVIDICTSQILPGKETMSSIITIDDIRCSLSANIANVLDINYADIATWEAVQFIIENKNWGDFAVLSSEVDSDVKQGKYIRVLGENLFKVDSFSREEFIK